MYVSIQHYWVLKITPGNEGIVHIYLKDKVSFLLKRFFQRYNNFFSSLEDSATMIEIDHDTHEVMIEQMSSDIGDIIAIPPPIGSVRARLNAPVITNNIEMEKISFERNKSGIWGWRSEKSEVINGYNCKVYGASNVEFVTKTRMDHLSEEQIKVSPNLEQ